MKYKIYYNRKGSTITYVRSYDSEEERNRTFENLKKYQHKTGIINLRKER